MQGIQIFFVYMLWGYFYEFFTGKEIGVSDEPNTQEDDL